MAESVIELRLVEVTNIFTRDYELDFILIWKLLLLSFLEAVTRRFFVKKVFLEISQNSQENTCARVSFLINLQAAACNFVVKETLTLFLSCEFCKISKNNFLQNISGFWILGRILKMSFSCNYHNTCYNFLKLMFPKFVVFL